MNEKKFKQDNKPPACTTQPWKYLIPAEQRDDVLRKIKEETVEIYGYSMDSCTKRKTCFTKTCIGRELPWKSPTAKPYLEQLQKTHRIENNELHIDNCATCPIAKTCTSTCSQVNDFINRTSEPEMQFVYQENLESYNQEQVQASGERPKEQGLELPWDILTPAKARVIRKYLYEQKDFLLVAKELDLNNQAEAKYVFYSALTKLSEYGIVRKFLEENSEKLTEKQRLIMDEVYFKNKSLTEVAEQYTISVPAVTGMINRVVEKYSLKWPVFVRKEDQKVIYNVPEVLK